MNSMYSTQIFYKSGFLFFSSYPCIVEIISSKIPLNIFDFMVKIFFNFDLAPFTYLFYENVEFLNIYVSLCKNVHRDLFSSYFAIP